MQHRLFVCFLNLARFTLACGKQERASAMDNILSKGGTDDVMEMYKRFRGAEPDITPMLKRRGLI